MLKEMIEEAREKIREEEMRNLRRSMGMRRKPIEIQQAGMTTPTPTPVPTPTPTPIQQAERLSSFLTPFVQTFQRRQLPPQLLYPMLGAVMRRKNQILPF